MPKKVPLIIQLHISFKEVNSIQIKIFPLYYIYIY